MSLVLADDTPVVDTPVNTVQTISLVVAIGLPLLVALVTKASMSPGLKGALLAGLSAISAWLTEWLNSPQDNFVWSQFLITAVLTFVVAVAMHFGFWQPLTVSEKLQKTLVKDG